MPESARALETDLRTIFGPRLQSLVVYRPATLPPGAPLHTLATVEQLHVDDLRACADCAARWHGAGLATPLLVPAHEFGRALDAFPVEFGAILNDHEVVFGSDPFSGLRVDAADLRRACEVQVRSHLLHLREGYIETRGQADALGALIADSVAPLAGLLVSVAGLIGEPARQPGRAAEVIERAAGLPAGSLGDVLVHAGAGAPGAPIARRIFPVYISAVEQLTHFVDRWSHP